MLEQYRTSEALEAYLGSTLDPQNVMSFQQAVTLDEAEAYPEAACSLLDGWGLAAYYVPLAEGGKLGSFEELLALLRVVARRDLTVAIAHAKTFLGAAPVWVGGSKQQKYRLAQIIANHEQVALALTERAHGSDLNASEVQAEAVAGGYHLSGEKWLINNATRGTTLLILARTNPQAGSRATSLFLVEKKELDAAEYVHLPRVKTHGIRGADISGIRFSNCHVPANALLGPCGSGLETTIKFLQLTRTMCASLSLGAGDSGLRTTMEFALGRKLYNDTVWTIPYPRQLLVDAFVDLLICDCLAIATARSIHAAPGQMSIWSAVAKYFVPVMVESMLRNLSIVLGARYYLRESHQAGIFQKIVRDNAIVSLFDGSTVVNLQVITQQLRQLAAHRSELDVDKVPALAQRLAAIFTLATPVAAFDPQQLALLNRGWDDVLHGVALMPDFLQQLLASSDLDPVLVTTLLAQTNELQRALTAQEQLRVAGEQRYGSQWSKSPALFELAKRHCVLHAAATCLQMWRYNRQQLAGWFGRGVWLALCLERLLGQVGVQLPALPLAYGEELAAVLLEQYHADRLFSIVPLQLAPADKIDDEVRRELEELSATEPIHTPA